MQNNMKKVSVRNNEKILIIFLVVNEKKLIDWTKYKNETQILNYFLFFM